MKMTSTAMAAAIFLSVATPALADAFFAITPSRSAEMVFPYDQEATISRLSSRCVDSGWTVISTSASDLVCESPLNMGQSVLGQVLMGNSYSTPPRRFFKFNVHENAGVSRAQASGWTELQMAFGQVRRTDFSGPEFQNSIFDFMAMAGGRFPKGTTFPNHAVLGFKSKATVADGKFAMMIDELTPGSPAARAGLQPGDVIVGVAGKRFKNAGDYLDATHRAAAKAQYEVQYVRGGTLSKATLHREFRPAITGDVVPEQTAAIPVSAPAGASSVADELLKLSKLRDSGILTPAEFDAQKAKLLSK